MGQTKAALLNDALTINSIGFCRVRQEFGRMIAVMGKIMTPECRFRSIGLETLASWLGSWPANARHARHSNCESTSFLQSSKYPDDHVAIASV